MPTPQQEHAVERAGKIFVILKQCADNNLPAPETTTLAERFGVKANVIRNALHFLESNAMISIEGKAEAQRVTITATGKTTAPRARRGFHRNRPKMKGKR
jgi:hypothetical protein